MSRSVASSSAWPMPAPRAASSTPVGPKKPRAIASWQAKPTSLPFLVARKQECGWREKATAVSLDQPALNFSRTQLVTSSSSGASARRTVTPALFEPRVELRIRRKQRQIDQIVHANPVAFDPRLHAPSARTKWFEIYLYHRRRVRPTSARAART